MLLCGRRFPPYRSNLEAALLLQEVVNANDVFAHLSCDTDIGSK